MTVSPPARLAGATLHALGRATAVTPHSLATQAAVDLMKEGGNAVDAAIAANATLGVVAPETCGIGGDLFALVYRPGRAIPDALNSSGRAGSRASAAAMRSAGYREVPGQSPWAVTVPGCIDGWSALWSRHGHLPWDACLRRAIELATDGFPATPELSRTLTHQAETLAEQEAAAGLYPDGVPPQPGAIVTRPGLAETLRSLAESGPAAFYAGPIADRIVTATSGIIQLDDLGQDQSEWVQPISLDVMGWTGWTVPPNSQGYLTLAAAWIFEQLDPPHDLEDPRFTHTAIEAYRAVAWERDDLAVDPGSSPMTPDRLLDPTRLLERVERISLQQRIEWPAPAPATGGTAYLCIYDSADMGVSLIQSNFHGIGSGIGVGPAGFFLHDRGSNFSLVPGHNNEMAPGKRPLHTLSPSLWTDSGALTMLLGTRGGDFQPQTLLQMLTYMRWANQDPAAAQLLPRWVTGAGRYGDPTVRHEPHLSSDIVTGLDRLGHGLASTPGWMEAWGPVSVITTDGGDVTGSADPRVASTAALAIR